MFGLSRTSPRVSLPGHAIECGWFLQRLAQRRSNPDAAEKAIRLFIEAPFEYGWDPKYGGLFYFLDAGKLHIACNQFHTAGCLERFGPVALPLPNRVRWKDTAAHQSLLQTACPRPSWSGT